MQTWIDNPVLGDTLVETTFSDYRDFGGVMFPGHIVRVQGGHPVLDLTVSAVKANPAVDLPVPENVKAATCPAGRRHRREARRRCLLSHGRHPSQPRDRSGRSHRRCRGPADRSALAGGHRQGQGNDPEQADQVPDQHARALRPLGRPAHVGGRGRDHRDARDEQAVLRAGVGGAAHARTRTSWPSPRRRRPSRRSRASTC